MKNKCVILSGPTAVGKTKLSIDLAKAIGGEIISADSMQVYKQMNIGTAKISVREMEGVRHHLIDVAEPSEDFNICRFQSEAKAAANDIWARGNIPIITGGTGFYIQSFLYDIDFKTEQEDKSSVREELEMIYKEKGADYLHFLLTKVDPKAANSIHKNNVKRVIRAIEYFRINNARISDHNEEMSQRQSPYNYAYFVLNCNRDTLYKRIEKRIDIMIQDGLVDEVRSLKAQGYDRSYVSMQALGYKEILDYLDGYISLEEAVDILKRDTRRFAKRQLTWFRREKDVCWIDKDKYDGEEGILNEMLSYLKAREII